MIKKVLVSDAEQIANIYNHYIRESVARQYLPVRWAAYAGLILAIVVFGAYGTGYDAVDFIYAQF